MLVHGEFKIHVFQNYCITIKPHLENNLHFNAYEVTSYTLVEEKIKKKLLFSFHVNRYGCFWNTRSNTLSRT